MKTDCIILGGGASGLAACARLAQAGVRVTLVERLDRVGKKLLSTGNGRCNLSNECLCAAQYGEAAGFVDALYREIPAARVMQFFEELGLMTAVEDGRIYPRTMAASSVLDVLRSAIASDNVTLLTGEEAVSLQPSRRGGWSVQLSGGEGLFAPHVIAAMGGSAAPSMGTDGAGVRLMASLGHAVTPLYPALVQLRCDHRALKSLKGVRISASLTLEIDGRAAAEESGELLFTDYGVSGVCVFQLSRHASPAIAQKQTVRLLINLLPELPEDSLHSWLDRRIDLAPAKSAQELFTGVFHRLLTQAVLREAGVQADAAAGGLTALQKEKLLSALCAFPLPVTGTQGFSSAQVTRGGVSLDDVDPQTMASRLYDGLYITGETLDVDGPCGGYNLHFAFAGALAAANAVIARIKP